MSKRKKRVIITSAVILVLLGFLVFVTFGGSQASTKVSELKSQPDLVGQPVRLTGKVAKGTYQSQSDTHIFEVTDGKESVKVEYKGILPNSFQDGAEVIADGVYRADGVFRAKSLLVKCPSKYIPKKD